MSKTLSIPFTLNKFGGIDFTEDYKTMWQNRVIMAVMTGFGERLMQPNYGTSIIKSNFESLAQVMASVTDSVNSAFNLYLPALELLDVKTTSDSAGLVTADISYKLPSAEIANVTVKTGIINRTGEVIQEF